MQTDFSKKQIDNSGIKLASDSSGPNEISSFMDVLSFWRACHEYPLQTSFELIQNISMKIDKTAIFARRLKRTASIVSKLQRSRGKMKLSRMQDIGGCRAIVSTEKKLRKIVRELRKRPEFRDVEGNYKIRDYLNSPKEDGYRSFHIVGKFPDTDGTLRNIEVQLRTRIQHYWATSVEIVDLFTGQALKSNQGKPEWEEFFSEISKQFALMERVHIFSQLMYQKQFDEFKKILGENEDLLNDCFRVQSLARKLSVAPNLEAFTNSLKIVDDHLSELSGSSYVLLKIDTANHTVQSRMYESANSTEAEKAYIDLEKETVDDPSTVVALVSSAAVGGIKEAYPNYFADSTEFLKLLNIVANIVNPRQKGLFERLLGAR